MLGAAAADDVVGTSSAPSLDVARFRKRDRFFAWGVGAPPLGCNHA